MENEINNVNNANDTDDDVIIIDDEQDQGSPLTNNSRNVVAVANNAGSIPNSSSTTPDPINSNPAANNFLEDDTSSDDEELDSVLVEAEEELDDEAGSKDKDFLSSLDKAYESSSGQKVKPIVNKPTSIRETIQEVEEEENENEDEADANWSNNPYKKSNSNSNKDFNSTINEQAEKTKQIASLKEQLSGDGSNDPTTISEEASQPTNTDVAKRGILAGLMPGGHINKRFAAIIGFGLLVVVVFMINSSGKTPTKENNRPLPVPEEARSIGNENLDTAELSPATTRYSPREEGQVSSSPTTQVTVPEPVPPLSIPSTPVPPAPKPQVEKSEEFGIELRAGTETALRTLKPNKEENDEKEEENLLEGASLQMILLEPFRSGISTLVKAQILTDVVNSKGQVVIKANSRVQVPFERFEVDGRVMNDPSTPAQVFLPNGKKLSIKGIVKGLDGFAGIKGKTKKLSTGNVFARMGRTVGRVGARVVGVTTGGFAGRGIEDTINQSVDQNADFIPTGRIVEILPGTKFTFNVN